jgi:predicted nucleic acid-binding protein
VLQGSARAGDEQFDRAVGFLRTLTVLDLRLDAAIAAGELDGARHAAGEPLEPRDTLVASAARENAATLVTRDKNFDRIPDLNVTFYDDPP